MAWACSFVCPAALALAVSFCVARRSNALILSRSTFALLHRRRRVSVSANISDQCMTSRRSCSSGLTGSDSDLVRGQEGTASVGLCAAHCLSRRGGFDL